jgi:thiamine biosynthesis protein ThiS
LLPLSANLYNPLDPMNITVNGEPRDLPTGETVRALVARYNLTPEKVAIELNRRLLRSEKYDTALQDGDEIEIVTFVGGG